MVFPETLTYLTLPSTNTSQDWKPGLWEELESPDG